MAIREYVHSYSGKWLKQLHGCDHCALGTYN